MTLDKKKIVSAHVVLKPASGATIDGETQITAATLATYAPAPADAATAQEKFSAAGIEVGPTVGIGFGIQGTVEIFEALFGIRLSEDSAKGLRAVHDDGSASYELPLKTLSEDLSSLLEAVTFSPPPEFGPTSFF